MKIVKLLKRNEAMDDVIMMGTKKIDQFSMINHLRT